MSTLPATFDAVALPQFRRALVAWYRRNARKLPWRETADPYAIWISEIMLQQTTVTAVVPYYQRFLRRFTNVRSLARADENDVLRLWEGLGYYSRARNIHKAARTLVSEHRGRFPKSVEELRRLPGIGRYTAGAIVSFAFDRQAPIVEANTLRLYCRLLGYRGDPRSSAGQRTLWSFAETILPRTGAGRVNQALMELGATLCTPENPSCDRCPVRRWCVAAANGWQSRIPRAARRQELTSVTEIAVAVRRKGRYLLLKRPPGQRWAGLWDFVRFPLPTGAEKGPGTAVSSSQVPATAPARVTLASKANSFLPSPPAGEGSRMAGMSVTGEQQQHFSPLVNSHAGVEVEMGPQLAVLKHGVTRYRITLECYLAEWQSGDPEASSRSVRWVAPADFGDYPMSVTGRRVAKLLGSQ